MDRPEVGMSLLTRLPSPKNRTVLYNTCHFLFLTQEYKQTLVLVKAYYRPWITTVQQNFILIHDFYLIDTFLLIQLFLLLVKKVVNFYCFHIGKSYCKVFHCMSLFCFCASCLLMPLVISFFLLLLDLFHFQSDLKINLGLKASFSFTIQEQIAIVSLDYLQK